MFIIFVSVQIVYCQGTLYTDHVLEFYTVHSLEYAHLYNADLWLCPFGVHINPLSPSMNIQILQTDLHTFP